MGKRSDHFCRQYWQSDGARKDDNCPFFGVSTSDDQKDKNLAIIQNSVLKGTYTDDQSCGDIKKAVDNIPKAPDIKGPSGPSGAPDPGGRQVTCDQNYQQTFADERRRHVSN